MRINFIYTLVLFKYLSRAGIQRYCQNISTGLLVLDSQGVNKVTYSLEDAKKDRNYSSLAASQPLVKASKVSLDEMRGAIGRLHSLVQGGYKIAPREIEDTNPHLRNPDFRLPDGKSIALYKDWTIKKDGTIDVMEEPIFVTSPTIRLMYGKMPEDWKNDLGALENSNYEPENHRKGLNVLRWYYEKPLFSSLRSTLQSGYGLDARLRKTGALVVSRSSMEIIVQNFDTDAFKLREQRRKERETKRMMDELFEFAIEDSIEEGEDEL